jgi:casein kinase I homolog HRR25
LESLGYMFIYFLKKKLPWQGLKGSTKSNRIKNIFSVKRNTSLNELCSGLPKEVLFYMKYVRLLRYKQDPNYDYLLKLFSNIMVNNNYEYDYIFDWNIIAKQKKQDRENEIEQLNKFDK